MLNVRLMLFSCVLALVATAAAPSDASCVHNAGVRYTNSSFEAIVPYLLRRDFGQDADLYLKIKHATLRSADGLTQGAFKNEYGVANRASSPQRRMLPFPNHVLPLVIAHRLMGEDKYTDVIGQSMQYAMGDNPVNRALISGLGERWFMPYHLDWATANTPMPAGIPSFGPAPLDNDSWGWAGSWAKPRVESSGLHPKRLLDWPHAERSFNGMWIAPVNEFTVASPFSELVLAAGHLAEQAASR